VASSMKDVHAALDPQATCEHVAERVAKFSAQFSGILFS